MLYRTPLVEPMTGLTNCKPGGAWPTTKAFTHVTACTLTKSPSDSLHQRLQQSRCLHRCSDCYRVERTSSRAGYSRCGPSPFHGAPGNPTYQDLIFSSDGTLESIRGNQRQARSAA